jgi:hypothetical protein
MSPQSPWVIVVIANPSKVALSAAAGTVDTPDEMLKRARSIATADRVCCVIEGSFREEWSSVYNALWPANRHSILATEPVVAGVADCLSAIEEEDAKANVIVIPYNHCAVEAVSWLDSAKGALRLGGRNRNTVYLLHDNPDNDPRVALKKPQVCTSSVMIGTSTALLDLCRGKRATSVVDLMAEAPEETHSLDADPLNVVHVREIEEYSHLQRSDGSRRTARQVDIQA